MGTQNAAGFTIIEVMLFLAISGALAIGVLVGSGAAIGQQRYRDSVNSLKAVMQQQYNEVTNVVNNRSNGASCQSGAAIATPPTVATPQDRGTSDCLLLGRAIIIKNNASGGSDIVLSNVVGYRNNLDTASNEVAELQNYTLAVSPIDQQSQQVEWGAEIVEPKSTTPSTVTMLIARSPISNSIFTFVSTTTPAPTINELVHDAAAFKYPNTDLCVQPSGGSFGGSQMAVRISALASSASAIQIPSETEKACY